MVRSKIARALVKKGADVNALEQWTGQTALMWAAARNHREMAEFLIESGADVQKRATHFDWSSQMTSEPRGQYRPSGGLTPLLYAALQWLSALCCKLCWKPVSTRTCPAPMALHRCWSPSTIFIST